MCPSVGERKSRVFGRILQTAALLLFTLVFAGCATSKTTLPRVVQPESSRDCASADLGRIGVVMPEVDLTLDMQLPSSRAQVYSQTMVKTFNFLTLNAADEYPSFNSQDYSDESEDAQAGRAMFFMAKGAVSIVTGLTHTLISGTRGSQLKKFEAVVRNARDQALMTSLFQANLLAMVSNAPGNTITFIPVSAAENQVSDFCALAALDIDTVMSVRLCNQGFRGGAAHNSQLTYYMDAQVTLIRVSDGAVLSSDLLTYQSKARRLSEWAEEDGRRTRAEVETAQHFLLPFPQRFQGLPRRVA